MRSGTLISLRVSAMRSNRLVSNSSVPVTIEDKKNKKRKGLMGTNPDPEEVIVKVVLILLCLACIVCSMLYGHSSVLGR